MKHSYKYCPMCGASLETGFIEGKQRGFCHDCNFIDYKNPLPVALAIPVKDERFLLIKRGLPPKKGMWAFPSGFVESGETAEEACLRELQEETGLSGHIVKLAGVMRVEDNELYGDMLIVAYVVELDDGKPSPGNEVEEARFFAADELPSRYLDFFKEFRQTGNDYSRR
ncbi:MAG TPA: NUDIX hydrolase [Dehalococcoidia bacterium]|nr:NUDIX hydrolase [Dehalococcoidia bacterium]